MAEKLIRKNIDLPKWVIDIIESKASDVGNKFKPYVEWRLTRIAATEKMRKEFPIKTSNTKNK